MSEAGFCCGDTSVAQGLRCQTVPRFPTDKAVLAVALCQPEGIQLAAQKLLLRAGGLFSA